MLARSCVKTSCTSRKKYVEGAVSTPWIKNKIQTKESKIHTKIHTQIMIQLKDIIINSGGGSLCPEGAAAPPQV